MSVATGVIVPLVSAALAGVVAWLVTRSQSRTSRENWVLDKRYAVYERVVDSCLELLAQASTGDVDPAEETSRLLRIPATRSTLIGRLTALQLVAPAGIQDLGHQIGLDAWAVARDSTNAEAFYAQIDTLVRLLREDLIPPDMR
ncbi:hypothetical protein [Blastococcus sp. TF02A-26]|uniref:hypothetical protein n=1 Tax=Blastococcus sp. TF02A-26 TaxID=2250577 RepID=UPI000DEB8BB1|nr:hypothetical protein [Blastococcus sp. TF02A-26]RBY87364.1 hypothetical protein DQ240_07160 [Blastococcus sp. TF02A-26]